MSNALPLPLRANNLMNLKQPFNKASGQWDGSRGEVDGHAYFPAGSEFMLWRAVLRTFRRKQRDSVCDTVRKLIASYAPADDGNRVEEYCEFVRKHGGLALDSRLVLFNEMGDLVDSSKFMALAGAMVQMETMRNWPLPIHAVLEGICIYNWHVKQGFWGEQT